MVRITISEVAVAVRGSRVHGGGGRRVRDSSSEEVTVSSSSSSMQTIAVFGRVLL